VPTAAEAGLSEFDVTSWNGLVAPAGTPPEIIARLSEAIRKGLTTKEMSHALAGMGAVPQYATSAEFGELIRKEIITSALMVKKVGAKVD
jgi:tripartite-type tricarboxylate transporter receptor subunit TctC